MAEQEWELRRGGGANKEHLREAGEGSKMRTFAGENRTKSVIRFGLE